MLISEIPGRERAGAGAEPMARCLVELVKGAINIESLIRPR